MAEVTDINKGKGTAQKMIAEAIPLLRQYKEIPFVPENEPELYAAFGGKPGAGKVKTPSKFTAKQTIALLEFSGLPLADENAKFSIADAIRLEAPDMFDEATFESYEKDFGTVMQMQEDNAAVSKNITTEPAKSKEANIDYSEKIRKGNITVGEAFEAVLAKKLTKSNRENISTLYRALSSEGIDLDANYFDVYDTKEFAEALDYSTNTTGFHRYKEFGAFETQFEGLINTSKRNESYKRLSGRTGIAASYGLTGVQIRGKDPMRGLLPSSSFDEIFNKALLVDEVKVDDTKTGKKKTLVIDPEARDYLIYERYTGQRTQSNIGADGIKIGDIQFYTDKNNQLVASIVEKVSEGKTRPATKYTGAFAEFLQDKVRRADANLLEGADRNKVNLFQTSERKVTELWDTLIRPELEKKHSNVLPAGKQGSHSVLRKILARQLVEEFEFPRDAVKSWMGHAGAGVDSSGDVLDENYTGAVPDKRIGPMTDVLIKNDAFNSGATSINQMFINRGITGFSETSVNYTTPNSNVGYDGDERIFEPKVERQLTEAEKAANEAEANARKETAELSRLQTAEEKRQLQRKIAKAREAEKQADKARSVELGITEEAAAKGDVAPEYKPMFEDGKFDLNKLPEDVAQRLKKAMRNLPAIIPGAGLAATYASEVDAGTPPIPAAIKSVIAETPAGDVMAAQELGEQAAKPVVEKLSKSVPEEGFISGLSRALSGQGMGMNYSSGGFINKNGR